MEKISLLFFEGISPVSKLIRFFTNSKFTHVAFVYNDTKNVPILIEPWPDKNTPKNIISQLLDLSWKVTNLKDYHTPGTKFTKLSIEVPNDVYESVITEFTSFPMNNVKYDFLEALNLGLLKRKDVEGFKNRFCCSVGCAYALRQVVRLYNKIGHLYFDDYDVNQIFNSDKLIYDLTPGKLFDYLLTDCSWEIEFSGVV
jgi:hypothetical protein